MSQPVLLIRHPPIDPNLRVYVTGRSSYMKRLGTTAAQVFPCVIQLYGLGSFTKNEPPHGVMLYGKDPKPAKLVREVGALVDKGFNVVVVSSKPSDVLDGLLREAGHDVPPIFGHETDITDVVTTVASAIGLRWKSSENPARRTHPLYN